MGKGLEKKQEKQQENLENERLKEATDDLFGRIPPEKARLLEVLSNECLPPEARTLIARPSADGKSVEFLHGNTVCGTGDPELVKDLGVSLNQTLFGIVSDKDGVLCVQVGSVDRKAHRPLVEDDDDD